MCSVHSPSIGCACALYVGHRGALLVQLLLGQHIAVCSVAVYRVSIKGLCHPPACLSTLVILGQGHGHGTKQKNSSSHWRCEGANLEETVEGFEYTKDNTSPSQQCTYVV